MTMIRVCDKCGLVIPNGDISFRVEIEQRHPSPTGTNLIEMPARDYCAQCMVGISKAMEGGQ